MTREEAIKRIDEQYKICEEFYYLSANPEKDCPGVMSYMEALAVAISALRPVSREQVWRGEWLHDPETGCEHCDKCSHTISLDDYLNRKPPLFCEMCGTPMTGEAVQMVMERLEAMKDAGD